jgi:hypothetical protein
MISISFASFYIGLDAAEQSTSKQHSYFVLLSNSHHQRVGEKDIVCAVVGCRITKS